MSFPFRLDDLPLRRLEANCPLYLTPSLPRLPPRKTQPLPSFLPPCVLSNHPLFCSLPSPSSMLARTHFRNCNRPFASQLFVFVCDPLLSGSAPSEINILLCNAALFLLPPPLHSLLLVANKVIRVAPLSLSLGADAAEHPPVGSRPASQTDAGREGAGRVGIWLDPRWETWTKTVATSGERDDLSPFSCSEGKVSSSETSLVHCNVSGESLPRSSDSRRARARPRMDADLVRKWKWVYSVPARPRPAPADGSPLSLPSDPHIPHSVHPAPRSLPAMLLVLWPPQGNTSSFRLTSLCSPNRPRISRQMGPTLHFRRGRLIMESAIESKPAFAPT